MKNSLIKLLALLGLMMFLTACPSVGEDPNTPVLTGTLAAGQTTARTFLIPSGLGGDLIYFELVGINLNTGLQLVLFDATGTAVRESDNPTFFGTIGSGFSTSGLSAQAITVTTKCRGACIIFEFDEDKLLNDSGFVSISLGNTNSVSVNYEIYAFAEKYSDGTEPGNNACEVPSLNSLENQAIVINPKEEYIGAIETVEDRDCFDTGTAVNSVKVETLANTTFPVAVDIYDVATGNLLTTSGPIIANEAGGSAIFTTTAQRVFVVVRTANNRAGPSLNSRYILTF